MSHHAVHAGRGADTGSRTRHRRCAASSHSPPPAAAPPASPAALFYFILPSQTGALISWAFLNNSLKDTTELQQLCSRFCLVPMHQPRARDSASSAQPQRELWPERAQVGTQRGRGAPSWTTPPDPPPQREHTLQCCTWSSSSPPGSDMSCTGHRITESQNSVGHKGT